MNIAEQMMALIDKNKKDLYNFNGLEIFLCQECKNSWCKNYAIAQGYFFEHMDVQDSPYVNLDTDKAHDDYEDYVIANFFEGAVKCNKSRDVDKVPYGKVVVVFFRGSQEIEAYRKGYLSYAGPDGDSDYQRIQENILESIIRIRDDSSWIDGKVGDGWLLTPTIQQICNDSRFLTDKEFIVDFLNMVRHPDNWKDGIVGGPSWSCETSIPELIKKATHL